jgi:hypothetical protein
MERKVEILDPIHREVQRRGGWGQPSVEGTIDETVILCRLMGGTAGLSTSFGAKAPSSAQDDTHFYWVFPVN